MLVKGAKRFQICNKLYSYKEIATITQGIWGTMQSNPQCHILIKYASLAVIFATFRKITSWRWIISFRTNFSLGKLYADCCSMIRHWLQLSTDKCDGLVSIDTYMNYSSQIDIFKVMPLLQQHHTNNMSGNSSVNVKLPKRHLRHNQSNIFMLIKITEGRIARYEHKQSMLSVALIENLCLAVKLYAKQ